MCHPIVSPGLMTADSQDGQQEEVSALIQDVFWNPHASPNSVWTFVALYPVLVLAIYRRSRSLLGVALLSVIVNLRVVSPPASDEAWATRVVLGEQVWLERGLRSQKSAVGLTTVGAMAHLFTLKAAMNQEPVRTAVGTVTSMVLMLLFFHRMVQLYNTVASAERDGASSE